MEVVRVGGGLEDNMAGGDEPDNNQDEIQDRKLVCMVRWIDNQTEVEFVQFEMITGSFFLSCYNGYKEKTGPGRIRFYMFDLHISSIN